MRKVAFVIANENYTDAAIHAVPWAGHDAERIAAALQTLGVAAADCHLLIDQEATQKSISKKLQACLGELEPEDVLFCYIVGRTLTKEEQNYLACHDTKRKDWQGTSVALEPLLKELLKTPCRQLNVFLDLHRTDNTEPLNEIVLTELFKEHQNAVCFVASKDGEESLGSGQLQRGIWSHHVTEALSGRASTALKQGKLTATSLQEYLSQALPRTIRTTFSVKKQQTPWICGNEPSDLLLADLRPILSERTKSQKMAEDLSPYVAFIHTQAASVKQLSGFKKTHRVPETANRSSEEFVLKLAESDLKQNVDLVYGLLKDAFRFPRADMTTSVPGDGTGTIVTPLFNYSIAVSLNPENPAEVIWEKSVDSIREWLSLSTKAFETVFHNSFNTLEFTLPAKVRLEPFIDMIENLNNKSIRVEYDREVTFCDLRIKGIAAAIRLTPQALAIVHQLPQRPKTLLKSLTDFQRMIAKEGLPMLMGGP